MWSLAEWYHAEAVELEESKIFDVVGFKCCRCRRIRSPVCPYMDHKDKLPEGKKTRSRDMKLGVGVDSDSGMISQFKECKSATPLLPMEVACKQESKEFEPATPVFPMGDVLTQEFIEWESGALLYPKEEGSKEESDPLLLPLASVELITEHNPDLDTEWNTATGPGPQKLPVRRHAKREGDADGLSACNFLQAELRPSEEQSSPQAEVDVENEMMLDYEGFNYEDMEFEPQTYFSVSELLASDDVGPCDGVDDTSGDCSGSLENAYGTNSHDEVPNTVSHQQEPSNSVKNTVNRMPCWRCSHTEPPPDISCQICGLQIHRNCSPWVESSFGETSWRCGDCREWQ